jgi:pSer/pThr/pTyr-binding forkhead associated (FHA) protein
MQPEKIALTVLYGNLRKTRYVFKGVSRGLVGRADDCDIQIPTQDEYMDISRHHCLFEIDPPTIRVRDCGSANGTYVNGEKIGQRAPRQPRAKADLRKFRAHQLKDGDEVQVGKIIFQVSIDIASNHLQPLLSV